MVVYGAPTGSGFYDKKLWTRHNSVQNTSTYRLISEKKSLTVYLVIVYMNISNSVYISYFRGVWNSK